MKTLKWVVLAVVLIGVTILQWTKGPAASGLLGAFALLIWLWSGGGTSTSSSIQKDAEDTMDAVKNVRARELMDHNR